MKSTKATKAFAKQMNAIHAANGLFWDSPEGQRLAGVIREYKARVMAYHDANRISWKDWKGDVTALFTALPVDFGSIGNQFQRAVFMDVFVTRLTGRRKTA